MQIVAITQIAPKSYCTLKLCFLCASRGCARASRSSRSTLVAIIE